MTVKFYVYIIAEQFNPSLRGSQCVKIGVAGNIVRRLSQLQTGNPKKLQLVMEFGPMSRMQAYRLEGQFHEQLSSECVGGEWFDRKVLRRLRDLDGLSLCGDVKIHRTKAGMNGLYKLKNLERMERAVGMRNITGESDEASLGN